MFNKSLIAFSLFVMVTAISCKTRQNDPPVASQENLDLAIQQAVDNSIIPSARAFADQVNELDFAASDFCATLDEATLLELKNQWRLLQERWYRLASYNFGPLSSDLVFPEYTFIDSLRLRGTNYLGSVRLEIADDLNNTAILDDAYFSSKTFQFVGLLALEATIFETALGGNFQDAENIVAEFQLETRKCDILLGLINQLLEHALDVQNNWEDDFNNTGTSYRALLLNDQLDDGTAPLTQIIVSTQEYLDYLKRRNVATVTAQLSDHAWQSLAAVKEEVETLLQGTDDTTLSFFDMMTASGNQNAVALVRQNIDELQQAITDENTIQLEIALGKLDGNFKREIPESLNVELGINFTDGD